MAVYSDLDSFADAFLDQIEDIKLRNKLGLGALRIIRKRTREGLDVDGNPFAEYSESYKPKREANELPTDTPDLAFSVRDGMMQQLRYDLSDGGVDLGFDTAEKALLASYHNTKGAGRSKVIRLFFGLSTDEEQQLADLIDDDLAVAFQSL